MTWSPALLFAGSYARSDQPGLYAFGFDHRTGGLIALGSFTGLANPSFVAVHPNGRWLYAVSETSQEEDGTPGGVWALRWTREPFSIQPLNSQPSGGDLPCHLQFDATGQWLFVSNYGNGRVGLFPIRSDGTLAERTDLVQHHGHGPNPKRQEGPHAHSVTLTPDNRFAIVADLGIDQLVVYQFDTSAGKLRLHAQIPTQPGAGPRHLAFHPNSRIVYVANELDNSVSVYAYDAANGRLREIQTLDTLPPGAPENTAADIHVSTTAERVYVSNRGHNSIAIYHVEAEGTLTRVAVVPCGGDWPRNFALAPGERFMLVANQYSGNIAVLPLRAGADEIGAPMTRVAVPGASCVQFG